MLVSQYFRPVPCTVLYFMIQFVCQKFNVLEVASEVTVYSGSSKRNSKRFYHLFVKHHQVI